MLCALARQGRCSLGLLVQLDLNYGALEEFECRDDHFEEDGQIISRETAEKQTPLTGRLQVYLKA